MKQKIRNIMVRDKEYVYVLTSKYSNGKSLVRLTVSWKECKRFACTFKFSTWDHPLAGSPLLTGVDLRNKKTNNTERFNLHHPKRIEEFIIYALDQGWNGETSIEYPNGLDILNQMGFDTEFLLIGWANIEADV
ncbi:hypothetical protein [Paenibacillus sanfengchensis]|uniref:hypothetical protein n=1 Tax=Paenibacillus sanfengchensis TaxID=3119819 RepID=UPI002FDFC7B4